MLKAKLNSRFYLKFAVNILEIIIAPHIVYGVLSENLQTDNGPYNLYGKILMTAIFSLVFLISVPSFFASIKLIRTGCGFIMDGEGISSTMSVSHSSRYLAMGVSIEKIPYSAIEAAYIEGDVLTVIMNKDQIEAPSLLKPFIKKKYRFMYGMVVNEVDEICEYFNRFTNNKFFVSDEEMKEKINDVIPSGAEIVSFNVEDKHYIELYEVTIDYQGVKHVFEATCGSVFYNGDEIYNKESKNPERESIFPALLDSISKTFDRI